MANETATKSKRFYCVSLLPDICKTPIGPSTPPIPYSVIGEFSQATNESPNVKAHSEPVILHTRSVIPTVKGDEPGTAGGIKSGTCGKKVETKTASKTYFANGTATVQVGCEVWMNDRNTIGKIYERGGIAPRTRLEQIAALAKETLDETIDDARTALRPAAKRYKDYLSEVFHDAAGSAMDKGGEVAMGGMAIAGTGAVATATGVGASVGVPLAAIGTVGTAAGGTVTAVGVGLETGATLLDYAADFILSNKTPDLKSVAMELGQRVIAGTIGNKLPMLKPVLGKGKVGTKSSAPPPSPKRPPDKAKGGKTKKNKEKKSDKPSECCPKNKAPGGKAVSSRHPVHFGTGEEVLYQTDFVVEGPIPLEWVRCYRSGSELEDWGMLGTRWAMPFTASIAVTGKGLIYVDDSGRPMMLPGLAPGAAFDNRKEGFTLTRSGESEFIVEWRDGTTDKFVRTPSADSWLPHGYEGVNAMRYGGEPLIAERYTVCRMQGRDGRGISIDRFPEAQPGQVLLRLRSDEGQHIEALRDDSPQMLADGSSKHARIGRVEEVRSDGTRVCHVRYEYAAEPAAVLLHEGAVTLPTRYNLARQTNLVGSERSYEYHHHLLTSYTTYTGFAHTLQWISLAALRERWMGNTALPDDALIALFPVTPENSYQARASATATADGLDGVRIVYLDEDTTRVIDANGGVLEYVFDANWLAIDVRRVDATGNASSLGRRVWDRDGMLLAEIDAVGRTTRYIYDSTGNVTTITDALARSSRIEYDAQNQPVAIIDPLGSITRLEYDHSGKTTAQIDALGHITSYRYDDDGRLMSVTDAKGGVQQVRYDHEGRLKSLTDCSGYPTSYEYDGAGRVAAVIDALGQITKYTYDPLGNTTSVCQPDGSREQFSYDADARLAVHTDAAGYETRYRYNGHGLPVERVDALGHSVQYRYNSLLQLNELINANGESCYFTYEVEGRLSSEAGFDGKKTQYRYNAGGELVETRCGDTRICLLRDAIGRLVAKQTADAIYRFGYDLLDRMTLAVGPHAQNHFTYDVLGRVVEERSAYFFSPPREAFNGPRNADARFVISHAYDELGNRIQTILPNGKRIDILRYGSGHWHGTLWDGHTVVDLERDRLHREEIRRFGTDRPISAVREYNAQSRISKATLTRDPGVGFALRVRTFNYDVMGNLLNIVSESNEMQVSSSSLNCTYDPLGQLLSSVQPGLAEKFVFDPAGNLVDQTSDTSAASLSRTSSQSEQDVECAQRSYRGYQYTYDRFGNVTKKISNSAEKEPGFSLNLAYDTEDRLISAVRNDIGRETCAKYLYDSFGRRIGKFIRTTTDTSSSPLDQISETIFVWDGDCLVQEFSGPSSKSYLYEDRSFIPIALVTGLAEPSTLNSDGQLAVQSNDDIIFFNCDPVGMPRETVSLSGTVIESGKLHAWGRITWAGSELTGPRSHQSRWNHSLRFQGQYEDMETGLYYNRHRFYDPESGRYCTQDPLGLYGGINSYSYAPNPSGWIDPTGLKRTCEQKHECDPCAGKNPAAWARQWQGSREYPGRDSWTNIRLAKGTIIYGGAPGQTGFYFDNETLDSAGTSKSRLGRSLQILPHPRLGYRPRVQAYRVKRDTCVAISIANAQDPMKFGSGGGTQFFLSNFKSALAKHGQPIPMN